MKSKYAEILPYVLDQIYISASVSLTAFPHVPLNLTFSGRASTPSQAFSCLKFYFHISELRCCSWFFNGSVEIPSP